MAAFAFPASTFGQAGGALSSLAASTAAGQWALYGTQNLNTVFAATGASGYIMGYADDMNWDPVSRQAFFIGGDHNDLAQFARYTESSNSWARLDRDWIGGGNQHGYNHQAINIAAGDIYYRPFNGGSRIYKYNIGTGTLSTLPNAPVSNACCDAIEYFPELGGLVWVQGYGDIWLFRESTDEWTKLATLPAGGTWQIAEYNPVHKVLVFALARKFYRLSSGGQITPLGDLPVNIYDGTAYNGVMTVDPVTGAYIVLTAAYSAARNFYTYDVVADRWQLAGNQPSNIPNLARNSAVIATPVSNYGVILFVYCYNRGTCGTFIYKHAPGTQPAPDTVAPQIAITSPANEALVRIMN
jgi:hypothetical protein